MASLKLVAEDYFSGFPAYQYQPFFLKVIVKTFPLGFIERNKRCLVLNILSAILINDQTIFRPNPQWIGYDSQWSTRDTRSIIVHTICPLNYCLDKSVNIHADTNSFDQDAQCSTHRTGVLCGECEQNYSLGFGSSRCLSGCNTDHRYLRYLRVCGLLAVCGVAGILLVVMVSSSMQTLCK